MQANLPLEQIVPNLAQCGYHGIELRGLDPHLPPNTTPDRAREIRNLCEKNHIQIIGIAGYEGDYIGKDYQHCTRQLEALEQHCKLANILGCDMVRHFTGGTPVYRATENHWREAVAWMQKACDLAMKYKVRLLGEIHTGGLIESADDIMRLISLVGRDNFGAIHDAGNMYIAGVNYGEESVRTLGDRLFHVHVKDELRVNDSSLPHAFLCETRNGKQTFQATLLDQGGTDHRPMLRALKEIGYKGAISLECMIAKDDPSIPKKEIATLKKMMSETGISIS